MYLFVKSPVVVLAAIHILILVCIPTVEGITCFQCNSKNNSACTTLVPNKEGDMIRPLPCVGDFEGNQPFCRKVDIEILDITPSERRTVRSCGWMKHKTDCYTANNEDHNERSCQCFTDACNSAWARAVPLHLAFLGLALLGLASILASP